MTQQFQGRIGIGDGWLLVFEEPFLDTPIVGDDVLTFSNETLLVLPKVIPVPPHITDEWLRDWNRSAASKAVEQGNASEDLGAIAGSGWAGSLALQQLPDGGEWKMMAFMAAQRANLHLTVRFRDRARDQVAARKLIESVVHDAAGAEQMNRQLRDAE